MESEWDFRHTGTASTAIRILQAPEPYEPRVAPCSIQVKARVHLVRRPAELHDQLKPKGALVIDVVGNSEPRKTANQR
jgi:hypothetical protein